MRFLKYLLRGKRSIPRLVNAEEDLSCSLQSRSAMPSAAPLGASGSSLRDAAGEIIAIASSTEPRSLSFSLHNWKVTFQLRTAAASERWVESVDRHADC